jgi:hypothetical protein
LNFEKSTPLSNPICTFWANELLAASIISTDNARRHSLITNPDFSVVRFIAKPEIGRDQPRPPLIESRLRAKGGMSQMAETLRNVRDAGVAEEYFPDQANQDCISPL